MAQYRFTGDTEETFPDFSAVLQPGDILDTGEREVDHPRLELVGEPKSAASSTAVPKVAESKGVSDAPTDT